MGRLTSATSEACADRVSDFEELSEEEIQRLLQEAEDRLRAAAEANGVVSALREPKKPATARYALPKGEDQLKQHLYLRDDGGTTNMVPGRTVDTKQRMLADIPYVLEMIEESKKTVRI